MKHPRPWNVIPVLFAFSTTVVSHANPIESILPDEQAAAVVINFDQDPESDPGSQSLSPKDYFPLSMGIRKNSNMSLVPFCVAVHREDGSCTYIQYFEIEPGHFRDSDRAVHERFGSPDGRIVDPAYQFSGKAVGRPLSGYHYSGGGVKVEASKYIEYLKNAESAPSALTPRQVLDHSKFFQVFAQNRLFTSVVFGLLASFGRYRVDAFNGSFGTHWSRAEFGWALAGVGAAIPQILIVSKSMISRAQVRRFNRKLDEKNNRIMSGFTESKHIRENWTLIKGVKVSEKTYDAFIEFLNAHKL